MTDPVRRTCGACAALLVLVAPLRAQPAAEESFIKRNVRLTGRAGLHGELYDAYGISRRRSPASARLFFTPTLSFSRYFSVGADMMLSTEESYARQSMNVMGLHPAWAWGKAYIGDYSDTYTPLVFSGVSVTGGAVDLFPDEFRFSLGGGRTRRAVDGDATSQAYAQYLGAARIGYGKEDATFLHVTLLKVEDDPASLTPADTQSTTWVIPDTLNTELDTIWITPPYNSYAVTPQENLVAGFNGGLCLFEKKLTLGLEMAGAAFTRDMTAATVDADSVGAGAVLPALYTIRTSTTSDWAMAATAKMNLRNVRGELSFRQVGPGYQSLGLPSVANDRREADGSCSFSFGTNHVSLAHSVMADNLAGQKTATNLRNQSRVSVATALKRWRSSVNATLLLMDGDADADSLCWGYRNLMLATSQALVFGPDGVLRQTGLQYSFQTSAKEMADDTEENHYHTLNLTAAFRLPRRLALSASGGLSFRDSGTQGRYVTQVYSLRLAHTALRNRLASSLATSSSMVRDTHMYRSTLSSSYRLSPKDSIVYAFTHNLFRGARTYNELRTSLSLSHSL